MKKLLFLVIFMMPNIAEAALPANCIDRLIDKSDYLLNELQTAIDRRSSRAANDFDAINRAWSEYTQYYAGDWAKECYGTYPENKERYSAYLAEKATPMSYKTRARLDEICSVEAEQMISGYMKEINQYIAENNQGMAQSRINALEGTIKNNRMVVQCPPMQDQVNALLTKELPNLKNNAALITNINQVRYSYSNVSHLWERSQKAFDENELAPLDGAGIQSDFSRAVDECLTGVKALDAAGYGNNGLITNKDGQDITLGTARKSCEEVQNYGVDKLIAKTNQHNEDYRTKWRADWEKKNIKGSAMRQVYGNSKWLPEIEVLPTAIIWTYWSKSSDAFFAECKAYTFTTDGETLLSRSVYACE